MKAWLTIDILLFGTTVTASDTNGDCLHIGLRLCNRFVGSKAILKSISEKSLFSITRLLFKRFDVVDKQTRSLCILRSIARDWYFGRICVIRWRSCRRNKSVCLLTGTSRTTGSPGKPPYSDEPAIEHYESTIWRETKQFKQSHYLLGFLHTATIVTER